MEPRERNTCEWYSSAAKVFQGALTNSSRVSLAATCNLDDLFCDLVSQSILVGHQPEGKHSRIKCGCHRGHGVGLKCKPLMLIDGAHSARDHERSTRSQWSDC